MFITEYDVEATLQFAVRYTAQRLLISDTEWKTIHELREEIRQREPEIGRKLAEYIEAYSQWYQWHKSIEQAGKQGVLDTCEQRELFELTKAKDRTRSAIADHVRGLPSNTDNSQLPIAGV